MGIYCLISKVDLDRLEKIGSRLYTENRLNGDEMRDIAQTLSATVRICRALEVPEDHKMFDSPAKPSDWTPPDPDRRHDALRNED